MPSKKKTRKGTPPPMPKKKKRRMKKRTRNRIILIVGALLILSLLGSCMRACSHTDSESKSTNESSNETTNESSKEVTIEEQVIYDQNDIKVSATGLEDGLLGPQLKLTIENNSSNNITVQSRNTNVNGYMVDTTFSAEVASGKKKNDELIFLTSGLKECGITEIATMEFNLHIFNSDAWEESTDSDTITINTSIADEYTQSVDDSGNVLVDMNGIKIIEKGLSKDDSFWGPGVMLYIENNSGQDITVQVRDVSINGYMVTSTMSEDVVNGKKAISDIQFFSSDLEDNGIDDIKDVEFYFTIFDTFTYETIYDSDVINLSY